MVILQEVLLVYGKFCCPDILMEGIAETVQQILKFLYQHEHYKVNPHSQIEEKNGTCEYCRCTFQNYLIERICSLVTKLPNFTIHTTLFKFKLLSLSSIPF